MNMGKVFDVLWLAAVPTVFVGIPAALFAISERVGFLNDFLDWFIEKTKL